MKHIDGLGMLLDQLLHLDLEVEVVSWSASYHLVKRLCSFLLDSDLANIIHDFVTQG